MDGTRIDQLGSLLDARNREVFLLRVPGRVNLIGEHTDYNSCPVLPLAVDREIVGLASPRKDRVVTVMDVNREYGSAEFCADPVIDPFPSGSWGNYIKAGVQEMIRSWTSLPENFSGFDMVIDSTIPPAAGMSSSSAMVVLSALAFLRANGIMVQSEAQRIALAEACAQGERYTGTQGGGMDQAAVLMGSASHAMKIDFHPLVCTQVPLPESHCIIAAHSTVHAPKTRSVMDAYNRRSIECALAAAVLSYRARREWGVEGIRYIGDLTREKTGLTDQQIEALAQSAEHSPMSVREISEELGIPESEVQRRWCLRKDGTIFPEPSGGFSLHKRLMHVRQEWKRVESTCDALRKGDITRAGELMNQSHASCRDLHEISCPELDLLTEISRAAGAVGSRLTGAGFGGCTVNLVPRESAGAYIEEVGKRFYQETVGLQSWLEHIFVVSPSDGARELDLSALHGG